MQRPREFFLHPDIARIIVAEPHEGPEFADGLALFPVVQGRQLPRHGTALPVTNHVTRALHFLHEESGFGGLAHHVVLVQLAEHSAQILLMRFDELVLSHVLRAGPDDDVIHKGVGTIPDWTE